MANNRVEIEFIANTKKMNDALASLIQKYDDKAVIEVGADLSSFQKSMKTVSSLIANANGKTIGIEIDTKEAMAKATRLKEILEIPDAKYKQDLQNKSRIKDNNSSLLQSLIGNSKLTMAGGEDEFKKNVSKLSDYAKAKFTEIRTIPLTELFSDDKSDLSVLENRLRVMREIKDLANKVQAYDGQGSIKFSDIWDIDMNEVDEIFGNMMSNGISEYKGRITSELNYIEETVTKHLRIIESAIRIASQGEEFSASNIVKGMSDSLKQEISELEQQEAEAKKVVERIKDTFSGGDIDSVNYAYKRYNRDDADFDKDGAEFIRAVKSYELAGGNINALSRDIQKEYHSLLDTDLADPILAELKELDEASARLVKTQQEIIQKKQLLESTIAEGVQTKQGQSGVFSPDINTSDIVSKIEAALAAINTPITPEVNIQEITEKIETAINAAKGTPIVEINTTKITEDIETAINSAKVNASKITEEISSSLNFKNIETDLTSLLSSIKTSLSSKIQISPEIDYGYRTNTDYLNTDNINEKLEAFKKLRALIKEYNEALIKKSEFESKGYNLPEANPQQQGWYNSLITKINEAEKQILEFKSTYESVTLTMKDGSVEVIPLDNLKESVHHYKTIRDIVFDLRKYQNTGLDLDVDQAKLKSSINQAVNGIREFVTVEADPIKLDESIRSALNRVYDVVIDVSVTKGQSTTVNNLSKAFGKVNEQIERKNQLVNTSAETMANTVKREIESLERLEKALGPVIANLEKISKIDFASLGQYMKATKGTGNPGSAPTKSPSTNQNTGNTTSKKTASDGRNSKSVTQLIKDVYKLNTQVQPMQLIDRTNLEAAKDDIKEIEDLMSRIENDPMYIKNMTTDEQEKIRSQAEKVQSVLKESRRNYNQQYVGDYKNVGSLLHLNGDADDIRKEQLSYINEKLIGNHKHGNIKRTSSGFDVSFLNEQTGMLEKYKIKSDSAKEAILQLDAGQEKYVSSGKKMALDLKDKILQISQYVSVIDVAYKALDAFKQGIQVVRDMDTAMTELKKVTDETSRVYENFPSVASNIAKEVGSTSTEIVNATADWARMGYSIKEAQELAKTSAMYVNVGDGIDMETANASLISTLQGFQLKAEDAQGIVDKFNEVANNFAIDSAGIGDALQRSAASFYAANTDLSSAIALITATNSVVQNPEKVGNMWKTVSARLRGATSELEEMGEDTEGVITSTSKLRDIILSMTDFDIMVNDTTFKDIKDIIIGIGKEWDKLSDVNQAALLEKLAGKTQANALAAALENYELIEEAYETAENSAGSATKENEKYMDSINGHIIKLQESFNQLWLNAIPTEALKGIIDLGTNILNLTNDVGLLQIALAGVVAMLGKKYDLGKTNVYAL